MALILEIFYATFTKAYESFSNKKSQLLFTAICLNLFLNPSLTFARDSSTIVLPNLISHQWSWSDSNFTQWPADHYYPTAASPYQLQDPNGTTYVNVPYSGYYNVSTSFTWAAQGPFPIYLWVEDYAISYDSNNNYASLRLFYSGDSGVILNAAWPAFTGTFNLSGGAYLNAGSVIFLPRVWTNSTAYNPQFNVYTYTSMTLISGH
ncbi:MAG: hypothetical protein P4M14_10175 [Gammaproteobacteria bacterium]|nr:hypothetical protein [Gammaproteobacteria bacterium]